MTLYCLLAVVWAASWNMKWFPSGRAEHRASPRAEQAAVDDAADVIRAHLAPKSGCRVLFLQELRSAEVCSNLIAAVGGTLRVAAASEFRERDNRLGWQQCAIATDARTVEAGWRPFQNEKRIRPPRGFAYAVLDCGKDGLVACYSVHLKSDYGAGRDPEAKRMNIAKRGAAARQLMKHVRDLEERFSAAGAARRIAVLVGGDFNTDRYSAESAGEPVFATLEHEGFASCWDIPSDPDSGQTMPRSAVPLVERATHPGRGRYPDSTIDYVFYRGFQRVAGRAIAPFCDVSDHRLFVVSLVGPVK